MSAAILNWLGGNDTGSSSKTLALSALGAMPASAAHSYPHDGDDFGRCYRLLQAAPDAKAGLDKLATDGGPYWKALAEGWNDIEAAYLRDLKSRGRECYDVMRALLEPIEKTDRGLVRLGSGASVRFGR